jgi:hypothetical protein
MSEEPIQEKYRKQMNAIAEVLDEVFNGSLKREERKVGWALLTFDFGCPKGARTNYISNSERADMLNAMKEFVARAEGRILDGEQVQ